MDEEREVAPTTTFRIVIPENPDLPILHVNALSVRQGTDEFFLTLGVVMPPELASPVDAEAFGGKLTGQALFQCAVSRQTMESFIRLMQDQYQLQSRGLELQAADQETHRRRLQRLQEEGHRE